MCTRTWTRAFAFACTSMCAKHAVSGIHGGALGIEALELGQVRLQCAVGIEVEQRAAWPRRRTHALLLGARKEPRVAVALLGDAHLVGLGLWLGLGLRDQVPRLLARSSEGVQPGLGWGSGLGDRVP